MVTNVLQTISGTVLKVVLKIITFAGIILSLKFSFVTRRQEIGLWQMSPQDGFEGVAAIMDNERVCGSLDMQPLACCLLMSTSFNQAGREGKKREGHSRVRGQ